MNICMIGSGNVATHLSVALAAQHHTILGVYSLHTENAKQLAQKVKAPIATNNIAALPQADCYIFSVKDTALQQIIEIAKATHDLTDTLCIHTAGSMPLNVFKDTKQAAVLYPMQSFSKGKTVDFHHLPLFVEANSPIAFQRVNQLANELSDNVTPLDSERRKVLHLAAVFANNFTNHCCTLAYELLQKNDIEPTCLLPIIDETNRKLHTMSPKQAQTGPAVRWDENVMTMHENMLRDEPQMLQIYTSMSQSIHQTSTTKTEKEQ